jgi:hypothetical protein
MFPEMTSRDRDLLALASKAVIELADPIETKGMKFDSGKLDYTLLPWDGVEEVVKVLEFGAKKYARDNWKKVENAETRYMAAAFRHLVAHSKGELNDSETGLSHLAHAGCCLLFLIALEKTNGSNT